ncbi:MAG: alpha/beta fold hydrolase [Bacteroidota bacterium]
MRKLLTIVGAVVFVCTVAAQDSCLPVYNLRVKTIQLSTGKMAYVEKGKGKTILFIHGLGGNLSHWLKTVNGLSDTYRCIAIDLPGYGWSQRQVNTNGKDQVQFYAEAITEFLKKKKIKKAIIAGHSMGAQVAIITALQNKSVQKIILAAPAGLETFTEKEAQLLTMSTPAAAFAKQEEPVIRNNFKLNFFQQPADAEQLIQDRLRMKKCDDFKLYCETVSNGVKGMLAHPVKDSIGNLSIPVLIVFGANDGLIPNRYLHPTLKTEELANQSSALIPGSKVAMIPGAGHLLQFEKSSEMILIIKKFIQ